jgi:predicted  nucleic acid-binding Zn-ribbon protein
VKEQLLLLAQIQAIDLKRSKQREEEKKIPEKMKSAEEVLLKKKEALDQTRIRIAQIEKERREKELDLKVQEGLIVKLREKLAKLKTNEEYKANLKEIESAKNRKGEQEETLLVNMDEGDRLKKEVTEKEGSLAEAELQFTSEKQAMETALGQLSETARSTEQEWTTLAEQANKPLLEQYKRLLQMCRGVAVVQVEGRTCCGCHMNLPPQIIAEVRIGEKLLTCTYCHRILYLLPAPPKEG